MKTIQGQNFYSLEDIASLLGVMKDSVRIYAKRGGVEGRRISRMKYYTEEELRLMLSVSESTNHSKSNI